MTTNRLKDLGELALEAVEKVKKAENEFRGADIRLSEDFKNAFSNYLGTAGTGSSSVEFKETTSVISRPTGLKIYVPNQWFYMAAVPIDFMREILKYKGYTEEILSSNIDKFKSLDSSLTDKKVIYRNLRDQNENSDLAKIFKQLAEELLRAKGFAEDDITENTRLLYKFVSDPDWWKSGKTIERTDFYVSPIVLVLGLVHSTQSYAGEIAYAYATDDNLMDVVEKDAFSIVENEEEEIEEVTPEEQERRFRAWMLTQKNRKGKLYKEYAVDRYIDEMKNGFAKYGKFREFDSVFQIMDAKTFNECVEYIFNQPGFKEYDNEEKKRFCSSGFKSYQRYLNAKGSARPVVLKPKFNTGLETTWGHNRIVFGAPGTGKSYNIEKDRKEMIGENNEYDYERVTFHPDYSYANFVGTYKPVPCKDDNDKDAITYEYVPGPFMRVYVKALKNGMTDKPRPFLLIIEEINRADVAAVFGDIFQLLDRDDNGVSQYPVEATEDMKKYLARELKRKPENFEKIYIPDNMFIWATMNSADQGVFPMDTAFKRRWEFTYVGIDDSEKDLKGKKVILGKKEHRHQVEWNGLRKAINKFLADQGINEDKQLGPYFISRKIVVPGGSDNNIDQDDFIATFKNKVLMYLFEDAARQKRQALFANGIEMRYSAICREFDGKGVNVFCQQIVEGAKIQPMPSTDVQANAVNSDAADQNEGEQG